MSGRAAPFLWAMLGAVVGGLLVSLWRPPPPPPPPVSANPEIFASAGQGSKISVAAGAIARAVVNIEIVTRASGDTEELDPLAPEGGSAPAEGQGSGVILSPDGTILTNHHVVGKAERIQVTLSDGRTLEGTVVGTDPMTDLAVLQVKSETPLPYATFGDSSKVQVGDWVVAVGNPYGFGHTVTVGVLSARERDLPVGSPAALTGLLQTDAAINPGNSGGPLANLSGEVIGINTAIIPFARGIGFAVPSNTASEVAEMLKKNGKIVRPYLGVQLRDLSPEMVQLLELGSARGAVITEVIPGGPAASAGVRDGDVIIRFQGQDVDSASKLQQLVKSCRPGETAAVVLLRSGKELELELPIKEMPAIVPR